MYYKCYTCGRLEKSKSGPPKCCCNLPNGITLMKPTREQEGEINEYLTEGDKGV